MGKDKETQEMDLGALPFMRTLSPWNEGNLQSTQSKSDEEAQGKSGDAAQGMSQEEDRDSRWVAGEGPGIKNTTKETMDEPQEEVRQNSAYGRGNRPRVDNNNFFEERSNPLSSKGD